MNEFRSFPSDGPFELPTTQAAEGLPRLAWSLEDMDRLVELGVLDEDARVELIGGELVPMSPKGNRHEHIKAVLIDWLYRRLPAGLMLTPELGWRPGGNNYLEPDIVIYPAGQAPSQVPPADVLLVIEIGKSSRAYDRGRKAQLYAALGVRDYWAIDAASLETRIFRETGAEGYANTQDLAADATLTPLLLPALAIALGGLELG